MLEDIDKHTERGDFTYKRNRELAEAAVTSQKLLPVQVCVGCLLGSLTRTDLKLLKRLRRNLRLGQQQQNQFAAFENLGLSHDPNQS